MELAPAGLNASLKSFAMVSLVYEEQIPVLSCRQIGASHITGAHPYQSNEEAECAQYLVVEYRGFA